MTLTDFHILIYFILIILLMYNNDFFPSISFSQIFPIERRNSDRDSTAMFSEFYTPLRDVIHFSF